MVKILSPAGSFETLAAALNAKADAVYFGVEQLNMRSRSAHFVLQDLPKIVSDCKAHDSKAYLALNTIMYDHDIALMKTICNSAKDAGVDAIIASDIAVMQYCSEISIPIHCSTQLNISNIEAVKFFSRYAQVIVLARELTLLQVTQICEEIKKQHIKGPDGELVKIEVFGHGALCVAISGKCYMSLATDNASANRGACLQNCRKAYRLIDDETGQELVVENKYIMSPKDLCTIGILDALVASGISVIKIEGRGRSAEYVDTVTSCYKQALKAIEQGTYTPEKISSWISQLEKVYNRGFWHGGYFLGKELGEWANAYGSQATMEKHYIGKVLNYYQKTKIVHIQMEAKELCVGEEILIIGPTTGVVRSSPVQILVEDKTHDRVRKGQEFTIKLEPMVRHNDKVYVVRKKQ